MNILALIVILIIIIIAVIILLKILNHANIFEAEEKLKLRQQ